MTAKSMCLVKNLDLDNFFNLLGLSTSLVNEEKNLVSPSLYVNRSIISFLRRYCILTFFPAQYSNRKEITITKVGKDRMKNNVCTVPRIIFLDDYQKLVPRYKFSICNVLGQLFIALC